MIKLQLKIGKGVLTFENNDIKAIHRFSSLYGKLPAKCDNCSSENIYLSHKNPKENDYYGITCKDCGAELNFHQLKKGGFYVKWNEKMEKYNPDNQQSEQPKPTKKEFDDDFPDLSSEEENNLDTQF